jgi:hypothetical protein
VVLSCTQGLSETCPKFHTKYLALTAQNVSKKHLWKQDDNLTFRKAQQPQVLSPLLEEVICRQDSFVLLLPRVTCYFVFSISSIDKPAGLLLGSGIEIIHRA